MNAEPAFVERTKLSLKPRRNCTAGEASEPKVAVAITHFGGCQGPVDVTTLVVTLVAWVVAVVAVVVVEIMTVNAAVAVSAPAVPVTVMTVVPPTALGKTAKLSTDVVLLPGGGVTGLVVKPPETPEGNVGTARVTGELKPPTDCTVMVVVPTPPGLIVRLLGLADRVNDAAVVVDAVVVVVTAVTVNVAEAPFPVLPTARIVELPVGAPDATMNPILAFPPPMMVQDGEDKTA